ncbi:MAG: NAD(P)/FAD-dependent oxidoreductase, partial [Acidimicrobiales bacterium]|nr:NAD(P)/FAD-dependent oxidoreductase [Acidimicrobiales bacterium]
RRARPGGHWVDAYPFVRLHQPSRFYGVNSTPLGADDLESVGAEAGSARRASGTEICAYYESIMRHRLAASGRVRFFPMCDYLGDRRLRSLVSGKGTDVAVRRQVVDASYMASRVPATDPPPFAVDEGARCVPPGALTQLTEPAAGYVVVGGGKTGMDTICWLLEQGTDPGDITWICPQDSWLLNRAYFQPDRALTLEAFTLHLEAIVASETVDEVFRRLETEGVMVRIDPSADPTMAKGATVDLSELELLRRVENVVRGGHVQRITTDRVILDQGEIATSPGHLHVHCAAPGLPDDPPRPIFEEDGITLQLVTRIGLTLSGALQGFLESTGRSTREKNQLCRPTGMPHTPFDYLRAILSGIQTELGWADAPDLQAWLDSTRLNLLSGLATREDAATVGELQGRFLTAVFPALEQFGSFTAAATPRERARIGAP